MIEEWRDIENYDGCYQVSNFGRVKSIGRIVAKKNNVEYQVKEKILKPAKDRGGYSRVNLYKCRLHKMISVHRLVAIAFINRSNEKFEVNHKDENKSNNRADNLEWISQLDNIRYGTGIERVTILRSKPVIQISLDGNVIKVWKSSMDIERTLGITHQNISKVCMGKRKTSNGFKWKFA